MDTDQKITRLAHVVVAKHRDNSLAVVTARIRAWLDARDYGWVAIWAQVAQDICEMRPSVRKPAPEAGRARLGELMDDPVMDVVVQDDDGRRREVHDTLKRVKRRLGR